MIKSIQNAEHYTWGEACDGWHLLKTDSLSVIEERMPPGTAEARHYHNSSQQLFYVLKGVAEMEIEGREYIVEARQSIHVPKEQKHRIRNIGERDLEFIVISEPRSHGDRINCG